MLRHELVEFRELAVHDIEIFMDSTAFVCLAGQVGELLLLLLERFQPKLRLALRPLGGMEMIPGVSVLLACRPKRLVGRLQR